MSLKEIPPETLEAIANLVKAINPNATGVHIQQRIICDHCQDDEREAFPYYATDKNGRKWSHLCNTCFDLLECDWGRGDDWKDCEHGFGIGCPMGCN